VQLTVGVPARYGLEPVMASGSCQRLCKLAMRASKYISRMAIRRIELKWAAGGLVWHSRLALSLSA